jgi:hypothetical protein
VSAKILPAANQPATQATRVSLKAHFHSRKISTDRKFSENIIVLKVENFQLQNFFPTENLC